MANTMHFVPFPVLHAWKTGHSLDKLIAALMLWIFVGEIYNYFCAMLNRW